MSATRVSGSIALIIALLGLGCAEGADTFEVGPGKEYSSLSRVVSQLTPGDVVLLAGGNTYDEDVSIEVSGSDDAKITIRAEPMNGARPVLSGAVHVNGDHVVLEGLEIRDGDPVCLRHGGHDLTVLDTVVHDCPSHGILGTDVGSGSLTLERVEVYNCASVQDGNRKHQVYIATDEVLHPGSVFRMQLSFLHDAGLGASNIKSRAERTELYANWIENAGLYELELYGPDEDYAPAGWSENLAREDADVVGNVFYRTAHRETNFLFRMGGDGSTDDGDAGLNDSKGRVRFAYNTVIVPDGTGVLRTFNRLDSVEVHNNVFFAAGADMRMLVDDATWVGGGQLVTGAHNWMTEGATEVPSSWTATLTGDNPQLADLAARDLNPVENSALVDAGLSPTVSPGGHEFPNPLQVPFYHPGATLPASVDASPRPVVATVDIGAFEYGAPPPPPSNDSPDTEPSQSAGACSMVRSVDNASAAWLLVAAVLWLRRRSVTP